MKTLNWGETPWDSLTREELLLETQRMFAALQSARSVIGLCKGPNPSPFFEAGGSGFRALSMADAVIKPVEAEFDSEELYRSFFRYAVDLLFPGLDVGFGWDVCPKCGDMWGKSSDGKRHTGMACKDVMNGKCDGILRPLEWSDLAKKAAT